MATDDRTYVFVSSEIEELLIDNEVSCAELLAQAGQNVSVGLAEDPASQQDRHKEPVTIILASAVAVAALTPALKEVIRRIAHRDPVIRDRKLVPVEASDGTIIRDAQGEPILHWVEAAVGLVPDVKTEATHLKGLAGIEITLGGERQ